MSPRRTWDDDNLTDSEKLERRLKDAVTRIRRDWPEILAAPSNPTQRIRPGGGQTAQIVADDHDDTGADIDATTRLMALIREAQDVLAATCRRIIEDLHITNAKTTPYRTDVIAMCQFVERHAQRLTGQDHDEIGDVADELEDLASNVHAVVDPFKRTHHVVGRCTFVTEGDLPDTAGRFCHGRVEAPLYDTTEATCTGCEQTAPTEWWELVLGVGQNLTDPVTIPALVPILAERLHVTITDRQIRNWSRDGRITPFIPFGPQPEHPPRNRLFIPRLVLDEVARMGKQCANCGKTWHGLGDFCFTCHDMAKGRTKRHAEDKPAYNVGVAPPRAMNRSLPRHPAENDLCPLHDLPRAWCYCRNTAG